MQNSLKRYIRLVFCLSLSLLLTMGCQTSDEDTTSTVENNDSFQYQIPEQTNDGWETAAMDSVGMDKSILENLVDAINNEEYTDVHSIVIIKENKLVFEQYFPGRDWHYGDGPPDFYYEWTEFDRETTYVTMSTTKSIISALIGIAIKEGFINSVDQKLFSFFDGYSSLADSQKDKITVGHMLTMTSGIEWAEWTVSLIDPANVLFLFFDAEDPVSFPLSEPIAAEPGTEFNYNSATADLFGEIVKRASGRASDDFASHNLFTPLGIDDFELEMNPSRNFFVHGELRLRPRDMAKFGSLYLNGGVWNGT